MLSPVFDRGEKDEQDEQPAKNNIRGKERETAV